MIIIERNTKDNKVLIYSDINTIAKKYHRSVETIQKIIDEGTLLYNKYFDVDENAEIDWRDPKAPPKEVSYEFI